MSPGSMLGCDSGPSSGPVWFRAGFETFARWPCARALAPVESAFDGLPGLSDASDADWDAPRGYAWEDSQWRECFDASPRTWGYGGLLRCHREVPRTRVVQRGPDVLTTVAELFYLRHTRTCAAVASGAQKVSGKPGGNEQRADRGLVAPAWADACLSLAFCVAQFSVEVLMQGLLSILHPSFTASSVVALGLYGVTDCSGGWVKFLATQSLSTLP